MVAPPASQTFGLSLDTIPASDEYLTLNFSPASVPRRRRWGNYGLSADFLGDYFAAFFPGDEIPDSKINRRDTVKAAVSYIANELIENAVKYSDESSGLPISITLHLYEQEIIFEVTNYSTPAWASTYQAFIQTLLAADLGEFYIQQLEKTAMGGEMSNMGLLTIMNDYGAKMGWRFQAIDDHSEIMKITVMAWLTIAD
ncbi:slr1658 superfamily regulator [Trichothermofontia sp.]